ncbi:MAG: hypothetical protein JEY99_02235 [Spirochaetales bacterium]|nr:hypothetical protein [Spirochaetales bacterium]
MPSTIQGKYTFFIIIAVMLFLVLLLFVNYTLLKEYSFEQADRTSSLILNGADSQLDLLFGEIKALVTSLSSLRAVREVAVDEMFELFITNVLVRQSHVRAIYLGTDQGQMYEWGVGEGFSDYTPEFPPDYDPRNRPWYNQARVAGVYGLTSPYVYASVEALGITAVKPVYNGDEFIGVLGLDLILHGLDNMVNSMEIPMGGRLILLNQNMEILVNQFSPTQAPIMKLEVFSYPELISESDRFSINEVYGNQYMVKSVSNNSTGWIMLLFLPYSGIIDFSQHTIKIIIGFDILLMIMLGAIIAYITRRVITSPLDKIISVFRQFEMGDRNARIPHLPSQEFDLVARLFNRLSDQSAESSRKMEEKVEKRTQAVIRLQQENVRLRIIEEKERIYGNLHDSLGARLTSINISNHVAKSAWARDERLILKEMLERIEKNTRQGILDLKTILAAEEVDRLSRRDFSSFIEKGVRERLGLQEISLETELPSREELSLLEPEFLSGCERLLQELVSNTMKHAGAKNVKIGIEINHPKIRLKYSDDGEGFNLKEGMKNGFGLQGLYSRAERMGGVLKVSSKLSRGASFYFQFRSGE